MPDKTLVKLHFGRAAQGYDMEAAVQRLAAMHLAELAAAYGAAEAPWLLDAGAGTGAVGHLAKQHGWSGMLVQLDLAEPMCRKAMTNGFPVVCGDMEVLPVRPGSMDMVISSLALQWHSALQHALAEWHGVLRSDGMLALAMLTEGTLQSLRELLKPYDLADAIHDFVSSGQLAAALDMTGFRVVAQEEQLQITRHAGIRELVTHLRRIGATRADPHRAAQRIAAWREVLKDQRHRPVSAEWPVTYAIARKVAV